MDEPRTTRQPRYAHHPSPPDKRDIHHSVLGHGSRPSAIRAQFWMLCAAVVILLIIYAAVFWDTLSRSPTHRAPGHRGEWDRSELHLDLHIEDRGVNYDDGDEEEYLVHEAHQAGSRENSVAIGCAITTRSYKELTVENMQYRLPFLRTLLPSFCNTYSSGYDYNFYVSFDVNDPYLGQTEYLNGIYEHFEKTKQTLCNRESNVTIHFVQCSHSHNPAWAQNDAMMEAYMDNVEYFYRVNDDTIMLSPGWTEIYIDALQAFDPPYVGVVGPVHRGGNEFILTYDFVHKTHINTFGYYYPRLFTDWWADDWITAVYGEERTIKLPSIKLKHTQEAGQRYQVQFDNGELVHYQVAHDRKTLNRYLFSRNVRRKMNMTALPRQVISMSLWGKDTKYTIGALRNAQLVPVFFPGWQLRVYVEGRNGVRPSRYPMPPKRILQKLTNLGAEIVYVNTDEVNIAPMLWRFLIADDTSVESFIVRDSDARLNDRDAIAVKDWLENSRSPFHCIRDHPSHSAYSISGGLWGGHPSQLQKLMPMTWKHAMSVMGFSSGYGVDLQFLDKMLWTRVKDIAYCHDSYSCTKWPGSHPFPVKRRWTEHVGQVFDAFGYARDEDMKIIRDSPFVKECTTENATFFEPGADPKANVAEALDTRAVKMLEQSIEKRNQHQNMVDVLRQSSEDLDTSSIQNATEKHTVLLNQSLQTSNIFRDKLSTISPAKKTKNIKVWGIDFDVNPIRDIKYTLRGRRNINFTVKSYSPRCNLTRTCASNLKVISINNGMHPSPEDKSSFYKAYQNDTQMQNVTHFLCTSPAAMCELFIPFGKPLVVYVTTRYDQGRHKMKDWAQWNDNFVKIASAPLNHVLANNVYDAKYLEFYTGLQATVIPPLCSYVNTTYRPAKPDFLLAAMLDFSFRDVFQGYLKKLIKRELQETISVDYVSEVMSYHELSSYSAIIHIPYTMSTYTFCEHYRMNIPIFVPSAKLLASWQQKYHLLRSLNLRDGERSWSSSRHGNATDPHRLQSVQQLESWLKYADFYQKPHLIQFDSVKHLVKSISTTNLAETSKAMADFNFFNEKVVERQWSSVFQ